MKQDFRIGDHVEWNSEAAHVQGTIKKKVTSALKFKTYTVRASKEEPQYLIKSDKTDHFSMHKGAALKTIKGNEEAIKAKYEVGMVGLDVMGGNTFAEHGGPRPFPGSSIRIKGPS